MIYVAWALVSLAVIAAAVYLSVKISPWFALLVLALPRASTGKEQK